MPNTTNWDEEIIHLKNIIARTGLVETTKWGIPVYTYKNKNLLGLAGFKDHLALWFYHGVFLKDEHQKLVSASEGKTKGLRQWRLMKGEKIDAKLLTSYIHEAMKNQDEGKTIKPERTSVPEMPELMNNAFKKEKSLLSSFRILTPYKQKEYIEYINEAKREETKLSRLEKIKALIREGKGLHDKYK